ncbi:rhamnan synthesis F family protein [Microbacterium sp. CPCC 204701]|uniref:rhamnan synthesis F family protein n=1 Tax=Microbacterium sp. CPCC 204701 TaxID=2493084 RepID=UPI000FD8F964|nr:rhamnan synthesis F family protein [Microbacterium sp. CPCC 204701]
MDVDAGTGRDTDAAGESRRLVVYAVSRADRRIDDFVLHALAALRDHADRIVAVVPADAPDAEMARLRGVVDGIVGRSGRSFDPASYRLAVDAEAGLDRYDEVILTGDSWFGPVSDLGAVLGRMDGDPAVVWAMIENAGGPPETFSDAGFTREVLPWAWTALRREAFASGRWRRYWEDRGRAASPDEEVAFLRHFARTGAAVSYAFPAAQFPSTDPALFTPSLLLDAGCPVLPRTVFLQYPPYLDRFAVIGRELIRHLDDLGFPCALVWQNLARTVQPKALYAIGGMVEVLPDVDTAYDHSAPFRIAAIAHVSDLDGVQDLLARLGNLPSPYNLFVTTNDGKRAEKLQRILERRDDPNLAAVDVRVTPANRGRDMSDFFVGCRDVLLGGRYDLIVKVHSRRTRDKTVNVRRYFRRYQYDNLLHSRGYVANLLALFQREPGLGMVFPPMMHIGYATMGHAWGSLRDAAETLARGLGIRVPLDAVSPLAPFGGMWIGRPEALGPLLEKRWMFRDYGKRTGQVYRDLARVQERLVVYAGAELGYHARTVLTREHASISHTILESKIDNLFSTTRGWPVEQIALMQRAGDAGHLGVVALARMYIRVNHPRLSKLTMPVFELALRAVVILKHLRRGVRTMTSVLRGHAPGERR